MPPPLNISDLLTGQVVEWDRLKFNVGWNSLEAVQAICAFARNVQKGPIVSFSSTIHGKGFP